MNPLAKLKKELSIDTGNKKEDMKKLVEWKKSKKLVGVSNTDILKKELHKK